MSATSLRIFVLLLGGMTLATGVVPALGLPEPVPLATGPRDHPGTWQSVPGVPEGFVHLALLPTGKVLVYALGPAWTWDPATWKWSKQIPTFDNTFCSGMALLADGRLLAAGGTETRGWGRINFGLTNAVEFDPFTETFVDKPNMTTTPRFYPTSVVLADGRVATFAGIHGPVVNRHVEVYDPTTETWTLRGSKALPSYVGGHLMPDGKVFLTQPGVPSFWDPATGSFRNAATPSGGDRTGAMSVLLDAEAGKVMLVGGAGTGRSVEIYDSSAKKWSQAAPLSYNAGRVWLQGVNLPNGDVLAIGGEFDWWGLLPVEYYDVAANQWIQGARPPSMHVYHSTGILMPDGSILTGNQFTAQMQVYKPWYFYAGERPEIAIAPPVITYGEPFPIVTPDAEKVSKVSLVRFGSVTHSVNTDQRQLSLKFEKAPLGIGDLVAVAPLLPTTAPPGYYMLFVIDDRGVPSEAKLVQLLAGSGTVTVDLPQA